MTPVSIPSELMELLLQIQGEVCTETCYATPDYGDTWHCSHCEITVTATGELFFERQPGDSGLGDPYACHIVTLGYNGTDWLDDDDHIPPPDFHDIKWELLRVLEMTQGHPPFQGREVTFRAQPCKQANGYISIDADWTLIL